MDSVSHMAKRQHGRGLCVCVAYLVAVLAVKQYPAQFDHFCRVLGDIYTMFVTGCCNVDDHISVQLWDRNGIVGHAGGLGRCRKRLYDDVARSCAHVSVSNMQRGGCGCGDILLDASSHFSGPLANDGEP